MTIPPALLGPFRLGRSRPGFFAGLVLLLFLNACGGSSGSAAGTDPSGASADLAPGIVNLDDADLLIEDLRVDPELQAELSVELAAQLDLSAADADCLAKEIDVGDLLAMSDAGDENAQSDAGDENAESDAGDENAESDAGDENAQSDVGDEDALERILTAFDSCGVPRSVFDE